MTTNEISRTPAAISEPRTTAEPQPSAWLRISPSTRPASARLKVTKPNQSGRGACGSFDSSTRSSVTMSAKIPIGTLTKKIQRQFSPLVIAPPRTGPTATAMPVMAPNTPKATPRSFGWNAWARSASAVANMIAPPTPCNALANVRNSEL